MNFILSDKDQVEQGIVDVVFKRKRRQRTLSQNAALHMWCSDSAEAMTEAGFTQKKLIGEFKDGFELPVTGSMLKDIFREVGFAMFKKKSTADLDSREISEVHRVVEQRLGEVTGINVSWPSVEGQIYGGVK